MFKRQDWKLLHNANSSGSSSDDDDTSSSGSDLSEDSDAEHSDGSSTESGSGGASSESNEEELPSASDIKAEHVIKAWTGSDTEGWRFKKHVRKLQRWPRGAFAPLQLASEAAKVTEEGETHAERLARIKAEVALL
ncbi:hypothetical protein HaLaN_01628, partial [Haematococcus lacustris]